MNKYLYDDGRCYNKQILLSYYLTVIPSCILLYEYIQYKVVSIFNMTTVSNPVFRTTKRFHFGFGTVSYCIHVFKLSMYKV